MLYVGGIRCWKYSVGRMLLVMDALLIGKKSQGIILKKIEQVGELSQNMGKNMRKKRTHTIKNIIREK